MSNYYEYQDVKVMIARQLMKLEGWKVYGYHADNSDPMTDYYDPASWGGVAEKNGYILCVNVYGAAEEQEIKQFTNANAVDNSIYDKIEKLQELTTDRGATEGEEKAAQERIKALQKKLSEQEEKSKEYVVIGKIPGHMANPPRMNWHIEKDGVYIAKGNGILKYSSVEKYYHYNGYIKDIEKFKNLSREDYKKELITDYILKWNESEERAASSAQSHIETLEKDIKIINQFETFINKINILCGAMIGNAEQETYEKVTVTEYKKEIKATETENGEIKEGQYFIVKSSAFNHGIYKGLVYCIHQREYDGHIYFDAYKMNGKLTKECTGTASRNNNWNIGEKDGKYYKKFLEWFNSGVLAWCELQEVKTPYEVEKVVKTTTENKKTSSETTEADAKEVNTNNYTYEVTEDTDTRDNSKIYLVKVAEKLSRDEYIQVNNFIKSIGGYYSKFKHAFLFKENPTEKLNAAITEAKTTEKKNIETSKEVVTEAKKENISYTVTEDKHTQTGAKIWIVKPEKDLNKIDFAEVKRKFATIQGYYSSFKKGFIFKYNPTEALKTG